MGGHRPGLGINTPRLTAVKAWYWHPLLGRALIPNCSLGNNNYGRIMNFKCLFVHKWDGCTCTKCGKTRDKNHDWSKDCEQCSKCGKTREGNHNWNACKCTKCGKTREGNHSWNACKCTKCGKTRDEGHNWSKSCEQCSECGKTRDKYHNWSKDCEQCSKCGKTRGKYHDWSKDCEQCAKCGKTREGWHDWLENSEQCSEFGNTNNEEGSHNWNGYKCTKCGKTRGVDKKDIEKQTNTHQVIKQEKGDPPIRIDTKKITHAFIQFTTADIRNSFNTDIGIIAECNKQVQPEIWRLPIRAKFISFATSASVGGYPDSGFIPTALKNAGMSDLSSIVISDTMITLDGGRTFSKVFVGFAFRDNKPKIIIPAYTGGCIPA